MRVIAAQPILSSRTDTNQQFTNPQPEPLAQRRHARPGAKLLSQSIQAWLLRGLAVGGAEAEVVPLGLVLVGMDDDAVEEAAWAEMLEVPAADGEADDAELAVLFEDDPDKVLVSQPVALATLTLLPEALPPDTPLLAAPTLLLPTAVELELELEIELVFATLGLA